MNDQASIRQFHLVLKFLNAEFTKYRGKIHRYTPVVENISQKAIFLTENTVSSPQLFPPLGIQHSSSSRGVK